MPVDQQATKSQRAPAAWRLLVAVVALALACTGGAMDRVDGWIGENARGMQRGNLVVAHREMTDGELARLLTHPRVPALAELTLNDNALGPEAAAAIAASPAAARLEVLQLTHNRLGDDGAALLARWPRAAELRGLYLGANGVGPAGVAALADADVRPEDLELSHQPLGDEAADALARLGARKLHLSAVALTGRGARTLIAETSARHLVLDHNAIGRGGLVGLPRVAPSLVRLSLESAALTDADVRAFAEVPAAGLRALSLAHNPIGDGGLEALARAAWLADLQALDVSGAEASPAARDALRQAWGDRPGLTVDGLGRRD